MDAHDRSWAAAAALPPTVLVRAIETAPHGITIADAGAADLPVVFVNRAFTELTGHPAADVLGRNCRFLQGPDTDPAAVAVLREALRADRPASVVLVNHRRDGSAFHHEVHLSPVRDDRGRTTHVLGLHRDVTERVRYEAASAAGAPRDPLTRLSSREHLLERVDQLLAGSDDPPGMVVVLADLDGFRRINESFDSGTGDAVLCEVATRISRISTPGDLLARVGADQFALVRPISGPRTAIRVARSVRAGIRQVLGPPIQVGDMTITVSASSGTAMAPTDGTTAELLLRAARRAVDRSRTGSG